MASQAETQQRLGSAGRDLLGAAIGAPPASSSSTPFDREKPHMVHTESPDPLPSTGDIVALFDTEEKMFWCVGPMGTLKLMPMGRTLDNGCLFRVTRLESAAKRQSHDSWQGSPNAGLCLQSVVTGKYVCRNIRDRLHCDAHKQSKNCWLSACRVDHFSPIPQPDGSQKMENLKPVRLWMHAARISGSWVQTYESSLHTHLRFNCFGDYEDTDKATLYEMPVIRKGGEGDADGSQVTAL